MADEDEEDEAREQEDHAAADEEDARDAAPPGRVRAPAGSPPPLERVLRGGLLACALPLGLLPVFLAQRRAELEFSLLAVLVGLLATPAAFAEARLRGAAPRRRVAGVLLLLPLLIACAYLAVAQVIFTAAVLRGGDRAAALQDAIRFLGRAKKVREIAGFLGPSAFALTLVTALRLASVRLKAQVVLAPLGVGAGLFLVAVFVPRARFHGEGFGFAALGVGTALLLPLVDAGAARLHRRLTARE